MLSLLKSKKVIEKINNYRIYIALILIYITMAIIAPDFFTLFNTASMLKSWSFLAIVAIGFTVVLIVAQFDLSIGSVLNLGAILVIGEFNRFFEIFEGIGMSESTSLWLAWILAILIAMIGGAIVGIINGFLVAKVKVHSFIVTIGMLTTVAGFIVLYSKGNSISTKSYVLLDFIETKFLGFLSPKVLIALGLVIIFEIILVTTKAGRAFFLVGGNAEAAWLAGINKEKYTIIAFVISGVTAAVGGALFAIGMNTADPTYGTKGLSPLLIVLAATIIGGTMLTGGKGSVLKSGAAVLTLTVIFSGLSNYGAGIEIKVLMSGILLALVILVEAYAIYKAEKMKGQKPQLMKEALKVKDAS